MKINGFDRGACGDGGNRRWHDGLRHWPCVGRRLSFRLASAPADLRLGPDRPARYRFRRPGKTSTGWTQLHSFMKKTKQMCVAANRHAYNRLTPLPFWNEIILGKVSGAREGRHVYKSQ
jgi:hypothetical protein